MPRWKLACDACDASFVTGATSGDPRAICEGCQSDAGAAGEGERCDRCGQPLTRGAPRFEDLFGAVQDLDAVLAAWSGDPAPLRRLLPERPRFLGDLTPPAADDADAPALRAALRALTRGAWPAALDQLGTLADDRVHGADARVWSGIGIARQRRGDLALAEQAFDRAIALAPGDTALRLDRGALRARRGEVAGAREDFVCAGDRREARWNRAALRVVEGVAAAGGLPPAGVIEAARAEAGTPSPYWSDHTVGRLLYSVLLERARAAAPPACADAPARADDAWGRVLVEAQAWLECDTFWDRALVLHGLAALGREAEAHAVAAPLAGSLAAALAAEPCVAGPAGAWIARATGECRAAIAAGDPWAARVALAPVAAREALRRYRVPCRACGRGSLGVAGCEDDTAPPPAVPGAS